ncbi:MAG: DNA polymerase III subunit delta [Phycisphaerales bacterium JB063]
MARKKTTTRKAPASPVDGATRILVLAGTEEMVAKQHLDALRAVLSAEHGEVELFHFAGKSATVADVFDELRSYSLMMTYKLVVVDDADQWVKQHREALERYAQAPVDHATLVLRTPTWHKGKVDKQIEKVGAVVKCEPPKPAEAAAWLVGRATSEHGVSLDKRAASLLVDRLGPHLMLLDTELAKLSLMTGEPVGGKRVVTADLVAQTVGQASEEKAWVIQEPLLKGIASGSAKAPLEMVRELVDLAGHDEVPVMWAMIDLTRKLSVACAMKAAGESEQAIAKSARVWGPQVNPFMSVVRKLSPSAAAGMLREALRADQRSKSGQGTARRNLEGMCVTLTDRTYSAKIAR